MRDTKTTRTVRVDVMEKPVWFARNDDNSKAWADAFIVEVVDGEEIFLGYRECAAPAEQDEGTTGQS